jgi:TolA-binding protein
MARQAERMGQRDVARRLYGQVVEKFPETEVAAVARAKLE